MLNTEIFLFFAKASRSSNRSEPIKVLRCTKRSNLVVVIFKVRQRMIYTISLNEVGHYCISWRPLFEGLDVCRILPLNNHRLAGHHLGRASH
jgi:hypothetical protein